MTRPRRSGPIVAIGHDRGPSTGLGARLSDVEGRGRLELAALIQNLDAALGLLQPRMAEPRELDAPFVQGERLLERHVAFLELPDDALELGDGCFEVFDRRIRHVPAPDPRDPRFDSPARSP